MFQKIFIVKENFLIKESLDLSKELNKKARDFSMKSVERDLI